MLLVLGQMLFLRLVQMLMLHLVLHLVQMLMLRLLLQIHQISHLLVLQIQLVQLIQRLMVLY